MRSERSSHEPSSPVSGLDFSFPVIDGFLTRCDFAPMVDDDDEPKPEFPNRIRKYRKAKRWNLQETAQLAGMAFQTLQRWEKGHHWLPLPKVNKLAEILGCSPYDLLPYHPRPVDDPDIAYVIERMKDADGPTRRAILRSVKGLTDRDADDFEVRPSAKKR